MMSRPQKPRQTKRTMLIDNVLAKIHLGAEMESKESEASLFEKWKMTSSSK